MRTDGPNPAQVATTLLMLCLFEVGQAGAQSLGDVARLEAERRNQNAEAGRVYTNDDLDAVAAPDAQPPAQTETPAAASSTTKPSGVVIEENPGKGTLNINAPEAPNNRDEKYWRKRSRDMRENIARVRANIAAAERRLTALDQGPQTPGAAREREAATTTLKQLRSEENMRNQDIAQLKTFAAGQKVPPAWLEFE
jgi:hypothetical protein